MIVPWRPIARVNDGTSEKIDSSDSLFPLYHLPFRVFLFINDT